MKTKMYKYALITSVISLILCVSMFVGTTFAWFTDSVSSANNKILSGSLRIDVEVLQQDGRYKSIRGTNEALFNYDLWEPGIVQTANVRVVNDGTLALKYELQIEADGVIDSILNNELMLSDVIDVYYADKEVLVADSAQVDMAVANGSLTHIGTLTQVLLAGTMIKDFLLPESNSSPDGSWMDYATIALRMRAGAGNEYQDTTVFGSFDLRLLATQYTYEEDSFDNTYDLQLQKGLIFDDGKEHSVSEIVTLSPHNEETDVLTAIGAGTVVNITGGYYDVGNRDCAIWAKDGAVVNIYGGAFFCDGLGEEATSSNHQDLIYAGANGGTINVYGGLFSSRSAGAWLLNQKDGEGKINLYGGTFVDWNPADNASEGEGTNFLPANTALLTSQKGTSTYYSIIPADSAVVDNGNNTYEILGNVTTMDVPVFSELDATQPYVVNGNGYTVTGVMFEHDRQYWDPTGYVPTTAITFSAQNNSKVTVNDLTITGTIHNVHAGDYRKGKSGINVTEFNNVNIINAETFVMSSQWCVGLYGCGTITLNNCNMYGTTRSTLDPYYELIPNAPVYDVILCNGGSKTTINGGKYGSIKTGNGARLTVNGAEIDAIYALSGSSSWYVKINEGSKVGTLVAETYAVYIYINDGAEVGVLDLTKYNKNSFDHISITDGAKIGKIIYAGQEFVAQDGKTAYEVLTEWRISNGK